MVRKTIVKEVIKNETKTSKINKIYLRFIKFPLNNFWNKMFGKTKPI